MRLSTLRSTREDTEPPQDECLPRVTRAQTRGLRINTAVVTPSPTPKSTKTVFRGGRRRKRPQTDDESSDEEDDNDDSRDRGRESRQLSVIPTEFMPPLTVPAPDDAAVKTLGIAQSARSGADTLSFEQAQLIRRREGHFFRSRPERKADVGRDWRRLTISEAAWTRLEEIGCISKGRAWTAREGFDEEGEAVKPELPYVMLTKLVIASSSRKMLTLNQIYQAMEERWPYFRSLGQTFRNSIRHSLSMNPAFVNVERPVCEGGLGTGKGGYWRVSEDKTTSHRGRTKKPRIECPSDQLSGSSAKASQAPIHNPNSIPPTEYASAAPRRAAKKQSKRQPRTVPQVYYPNMMMHPALASRFPGHEVHTDVPDYPTTRHILSQPEARPYYPDHRGYAANWLHPVSQERDQAPPFPKVQIVRENTEWEKPKLPTPPYEDGRLHSFSRDTPILAPHHNIDRKMSLPGVASLLQTPLSPISQSSAVVTPPSAATLITTPPRCS